MAAGARKYAQARALKLKLTGELGFDVARVPRFARRVPMSGSGVDANQGYTIDELDSLVAALVTANVSLLDSRCSAAAKPILRATSPRFRLRPMRAHCVS